MGSYLARSGKARDKVREGGRGEGPEEMEGRSRRWRAGKGKLKGRLQPPSTVMGSML